MGRSEKTAVRVKSVLPTDTARIPGGHESAAPHVALACAQTDSYRSYAAMAPVPLEIVQTAGAANAAAMRPKVDAAMVTVRKRPAQSSTPIERGAHGVGEIAVAARSRIGTETRRGLVERIETREW